MNNFKKLETNYKNEIGRDSIENCFCKFVKYVQTHTVYIFFVRC
jgi:hypothetical protein